MWLHCALHHAALTALVPLMWPTSGANLALRILAHVGGLALACGVAGPPSWTLGGVVLPMMALMYMAASVCTQTGGVIATLQAMLDALLLLGHRWDQVCHLAIALLLVALGTRFMYITRSQQVPSLEAVLNCCVFYMASCGTLLLLAAVTAPQ